MVLFSFQSSVSYVGSQEPSSMLERSLIFQFCFSKFLITTAEGLLPLSSSLKINTAEILFALPFTNTCGLDMGICLVPTPLRLKGVFRKFKLIVFQPSLLW